MADLTVTAAPSGHLILITVTGAPVGAVWVDVTRIDSDGWEERVPNDARPVAGAFQLVDGAACFGVPTRYRAVVRDQPGASLGAALSPPVTLPNLGPSAGVVSVDVDPTGGVEVQLLDATDQTRSHSSDAVTLTPIDGSPPIAVGAPGRLETTIRFACSTQAADRAVEAMVRSGLPLTIRMAWGDPDRTWVARRRFRHAPGATARTRLGAVSPAAMTVWESTSVEVAPVLRPPIPAVTWADWTDAAELAAWTQDDIAQACATQGLTAQDTVNRPLAQIMGE
jgi:hypothetical protein